MYIYTHTYIQDHAQAGIFKAKHGSSDTQGGRIGAEYAAAKGFAGARGLYRKHIKGSLKKVCVIVVYYVYVYVICVYLYMCLWVLCIYMRGRGGCIVSI